MSFPYPTREAIRQRAGNKSELSERNDRRLTCCHLSHDRGLAEYGSMDMGVLVTDFEHYAYHEILEKHPNSLGLTASQNSWSLSKLWNEIQGYNRVNNINMSEEEIWEEIEKARNYWFYYLGIEA